MFVSASEDKTGILDVIEEKIARATMIPRTHGEVTSLLSFLLIAEKHFGIPYNGDLRNYFSYVLLINCLNFYI